MRFLAALILLCQLLAPAGLVRAQDAGGCDDLAQQVASASQQLDQLKRDAMPWLVQAGQFGALAPADLLLAAQQGAPGLAPDLAASFGGIAAQLGATIDSWRFANDASASDAYWRELADSLSTWEALFGTLAPVQGEVPSLVGMSTAFSQLDQMSAQAQGDLAIQDSLGAQLQECQANSQPTPTGATSPPEVGDNPPALCEVGGQAGYGNSDCFRLELDAAFDTWQSCTEAYFAAERAAFQNGSGLPTNTCDGAFQAQQDAIQSEWGAAP